MQQRKYARCFHYCVGRMKWSFALTMVMVLGLIPLGMPSMANDEKIQSDRELPITVATCSVGGDTRGAWWLSMNAAGNAIVMVDAWPKMKQIEFTISQDKIAALRQAISKERFFELKEEYGEHILPDSSHILTIVEGEQSKTVRIHFLMNWVYSDPSKLEEPARALRIFMLIRDWFDDPKAYDHRRYDRMVLDAVEKRKKNLEQGNSITSSQITNEVSGSNEIKGLK